MASMREASDALATLCGARTRDGDPCRNEAGFKTGHLGEGRCYLHGGLTPIKHGRYSTVRHARLAELTTEFEQDPDPLNIFPELAAARAIFVDFIERYESHSAALLAWHQSWETRSSPLPEEKIAAFERVVDEWEDQVRLLGDDATARQRADVDTARRFCDALRGRGEFAGKPRQILDIADAYRIVSEITKIVERIERVRSQNAISRPDFYRLMREMGAVVSKHVADPDALQRIREGWLSIAI